MSIVVIGFRNFSLVCLLALAAFTASAETTYKFNGEGEALLEFMNTPPHGQDYCSLRFYINQESIVYAISRKPANTGLKVGDRLVSIDAITIEGPPSIPDVVYGLNSKDKLKLVVDRDGKPVEVERPCSDDTEIDKTIRSLAESIIAENWSECRTLIKKIELHEKRAEWANIRMRCNYMHAESKKNLAVYWNRDWPLDLYQYNLLRLKKASYGSLEEFELLRPEIIQAISDLRRNQQSMYAGDLSNDMDATLKTLQIRAGLIDPEAE